MHNPCVMTGKRAIGSDDKSEQLSSSEVDDTKSSAAGGESSEDAVRGRTEDPKDACAERKRDHIGIWGPSCRQCSSLGSHVD